ncbi:fungal-specific transcription factor domain-containing protein [Talaromyces proteolyticus]|uniref:Fungal-specific transcription factor domain-containing protein n=1 Tax=Talaromyces proteolyticus TaxID=1131652 RepID=A0AAD4KMP3_9EURO|nr:fungal-specific transcription factor domain-containing protein [Talaromyces proteolyticus]KAH8692012.1 fungal-specific transcription factor domain-containing protein [Talaromyces proteolyticus]
MPGEKQATGANATSNTTTTTSRQRPGSACEECRRRKLRCDRQPQCGNCVESGVICTTTTVRPARGPKKGHLKALKGRIATLERCIMEQQGGIVLPGSDGSLSPVEESQQPCSSDGENGQESKLLDMRRLSLPSPIDHQSYGIPELVRADLDQLYFERVHPLVPILQRARYFTWAKSPTKSDSRSCLQYAMWTLAASLSTHCQSIRDSLYTETKKRLEALESKDSEIDLFDIEQAQAWLLLAIYQFMRTTYRKGWMSAGRLFRLVQLMRLYELDSPNEIATQLIEPDWVEVEEKRRTFWMAYTLDRFANIRKGWPITLTEQILTRLPMPEAEFQGGQLMIMGFLSDSLAGSDFNLTPQSSFSECILLATICGRTLSHRHLSMVDGLYGTNPQEFWSRHEWIDTALSTRISMLSLTYPFQLEHMDPMLLFTKMIAQATILSMQKIIESVTWDSDEYSNLVLEYEQRARLASKEIVELARALTHLSYFKVHPFTPIPLCICAEFLSTRDREIDPKIETQLQEVLDALQYLKNVNALAKENPTVSLWSELNMDPFDFDRRKR